jgi:pimeloyl-ACP methyl ester carboxylesterase
MDKSDPIDYSADVFQSVWNDVGPMRSSGRLLELGTRIECPVVALHGDYDSHPAEGVQKPLSDMLKSFRFILIEKCGHKPWIERQARDRFYAILKEELL